MKTILTLLLSGLLTVSCTSSSTVVSVYDQGGNLIAVHDGGKVSCGHIVKDGRYKIQYPVNTIIVEKTIKDF